MKGGVHLISLYLVAGEKLTSPTNRRILEAASQLIDSLDGPWIAMGDWQNSPEALASTNWPTMNGGKIHAPCLPTCGSNIIDFFVVSNRISDSVIGAQTISDAGTTPHSGTRLLVRDGARIPKVQKLKTPAKLRALPHGPPPSPTQHPGPCNPTADRDSVDAMYTAAMEAIESDALALMVASQEERDSFTGRANGSSAVWRTSAGLPGSRHAKQSWGSRRWRQLDIWLTDVVRLLAAGALDRSHRAHGKWCYAAEFILNSRR